MYTLDASVFVRDLNPRDADQALCRELLERLAAQRISIIAPLLLQYTFEPIKGYPLLHWHGKRPFTSTQFDPAQHKETHGPEVAGWRSKIY